MAPGNVAAEYAIRNDAPGSSHAVTFSRWLKAFEIAVAGGAVSALKDLFLEHSYWRDQIALTWDMRQYWGRDAVISPLVKAIRKMRPAGFRIATGRTEPKSVTYLQSAYIEGFCEFDLPHGVGQAMVRLAPDPASPAGSRCFSIGTDLLSLTGVEERHARRVTPENWEPVFPIHGFEPQYAGQTWLEYLEARRNFDTRHPDVLIVGGGHSGVMIGARLQAMGVSYLIIDKGERPGDSWRARYDSLALHTVGATNNLPYIPTPQIFPDYIPKDRWADWIESYTRAMALNYWSSSELISGRFDEATGRWQCSVKLPDGALRTLCPIHIALALGGVGSDPIMPKLPGLDEFTGKVVHSKYFRTGRESTGQRVLVVGTSTSGHDIACDLHNKGAQVTLLQRGPTIVARLVEGVEHNANYVSGKMSLDEADQLRGANMILPLRTRYLQLITERNRPANAAMNAALEKAGLRLWEGHDGTGWLGKLAREFKGFYINMGCADLIASGAIKIIQMAEIKRFVAGGAEMIDGTTRAFDAIVLATGFINQNQELVAMFGEDVARRIGPCSGFDQYGEQNGNARPLHHRQIWQVYGGINDVRRLSKIMALQIAGQLTGKVPPLERQADGSLKECPIPA
jgi:cation diffusion facilitator CzcD-associated flavoprotein CzcO